jgi:hypothetical protein
MSNRVSRFIEHLPEPESELEPDGFQAITAEVRVSEWAKPQSDKESADGSAVIQLPDPSRVTKPCPKKLSLIMLVQSLKRRYFPCTSIR